MPLPKPSENESREEFVARCLGNENVQEEFGSGSDQAVAVCSNIWSEKKEMSLTPNKKLCSLIRKRGDSKGIDLAIRYVRGNGKQVRAASRQLIYVGPDANIADPKRKDFSVLLTDKSLEQGAKFPEHTLLGFHAIVTTPRKDRDTDILETSGAVISKRLPLLWCHNNSLCIGKSVATIEHSPQMLKVAAALLNLNSLTEDAAKLVEADAMGISHGFRALEYEEMKTKDGDHDGFKILKFEVMEFSLVSVPSNVDAEVTLFSRNALQSDEAKAHAKELYEQRPLVIPVQIDLKVTQPTGEVDTKKETTAQSKEVQVNVSNESQLPPKAQEPGDAKAPSAPEPVASETKQADKPETKVQEPEGEKHLMHVAIALNDSWEWIEHHLHMQAREFLKDKKLIDNYDQAWLFATFADKCVLSAEVYDNGYKCMYWELGWGMTDGKPVLSGEPKAVELNVGIEEAKRIRAARGMAKKEPLQLKEVLDYLAFASDQQSLDLVKRYADVALDNLHEIEAAKDFQELLN